MKRNQKLCIQIMKVCRETEGSMPRLSHRDIEGTSIDEFVEHCGCRRGYSIRRLSQRKRPPDVPGAISGWLR